jgi:hypothetical protein
LFYIQKLLFLSEGERCSCLYQYKCPLCSSICLLLQSGTLLPSTPLSSLLFWLPSSSQYACSHKQSSTRSSARTAAHVHDYRSSHRFRLLHHTLRCPIHLHSCHDECGQRSMVYGSRKSLFYVSNTIPFYIYMALSSEVRTMTKDLLLCRRSNRIGESFGTAHSSTRRQTTRLTCKTGITGIQQQIPTVS